MARIRILPEILANKIAAGEVVERPASVVKELVENALDAQSDRIVIDIENGGRSLIQVADNGIGMRPDDALMALERFATSKISTDEDLFAIQTLGFRGEALPSIAAVSKFTLTTRSREAQNGVEVQVNGGRIVQVTEAGAPCGTLVRVAQLFFNTPARRKFMKSINTEIGHIGDTVAGLALACPQAQIKLSHNGKTIRRWLRATDPAERAADVLGRLRAADMTRVQAGDGYLDLNGFLAPRGMTRNTARGVYLFVNNRRVRDRIVQHALFEGYQGRLMKGQFPLAVLFLGLAFDQVDVNVHPTKHEIRFADQRRVHTAVVQAVRNALNQSERRLWAVDDPFTQNARPAPQVAEPRCFQMLAPVDGPGRPVSETAAAGDAMRAAPGPGALTRAAGSAGESPPREPSPGERSTARRAGDRQQPLWELKAFADLTVIGQFKGAYIICQSGTDLILIDQHAAHERIVYEQLRRRDGPIVSQQLLVPETLDVHFAEAQALRRLIPQLNAMGLEIEPFGGDTFAVKAFPVMLDDRDIGRLVLALAEKTTELGVDAGLEKILDECRMVMACHHAVRANQKLDDSQIRHMLAQLDACENPSYCPHGRPVWLRWSARDLEKAFKRTS